MRIGVVVLLVACGGGSPAPVAPTQTTPTVPCFADRAVLTAREVYDANSQHALGFGSTDEVPTPASMYGTCRAEAGKITDAGGALVAEIGCGVRIVRRGITDELGLQIGVRGADVIAAKPKPHTALQCFANGPTQTWCRFERAEDEDTDGTSYVVDGTITEETLTGNAAVAYFSPREVVEIHYSAWCH
jgi:hypothetical protein